MPFILEDDSEDDREHTLIARQQVSDASKWQAIVTQPDIAHFLRKVLRTKLKTDAGATFARCVVNAAKDPPQFGRRVRLAQTGKGGSRGGREAFKTGEEEPQEAFKTGHRVIMHGLTTRADLNGRYAFVLDPVAKGGRYHLRLQDMKADIRAKSQNFTKIVAAPTEAVERGIAAKRQKPESQSERRAPKCRRPWALRDEHCDVAQSDEERKQGGGSFILLFDQVKALILSYLSVETKACCLIPSGKCWESVMKIKATWEPLYLSRSCTGRLMRGARVQGSLAYLFNARIVKMTLPVPERAAPWEETASSDSEEDVKPSSRRIRLVDPFSIACFDLLRRFSCLEDLHLMGLARSAAENPVIGFVGHRGGYLHKYEQVRLTKDLTGPDLDPQLRCLHQAPPSGRPSLTLEESWQENRRRVPLLASFDETSTVSVEEAFYLTEHPFAFKNGQFFYFTDNWQPLHQEKPALYGVRAHDVRKSYRAFFRRVSA